MHRSYPNRVVQTLVFIIGAASLMACLFGGEEDSVETKAIVKPGIYHGDYGPDLSEIESELQLGFDGKYHWLVAQGGVAILNARGKWFDLQGLTIFHQTESGQFNYPEIFTNFLPVPADSAPIRNTIGDGFEKYEISPYGGRGIWVSYHRASFAKLNPGKYVNRETTLVADTLGQVVTQETRREFQLKSGSISRYQSIIQNTIKLII